MNQSPSSGYDRSSRRYNKKTFTAPNLLLVEGNDEYHFFRFLRQRNDVQIHVYEGKDQLKLELQTIRGVEGFDNLRQIAIVRDSDDNPHGALQSVLSQWSMAFGQSVPKISPDEWFSDNDGRRWSVWLMPYADQTGDLEELLWQAVNASEHRTCIDDLIDCLDNCDPVPFNSKTKARLYAYLSTQRSPFKELDAALQHHAKIFDPLHSSFSRFTLLIDNL